MLTTKFNSFPIISLKNISDADTITSFKDKVQFNFDQIYLNYVNKVLQGEKGERGYTGLSVKGDKGIQGEVGTKVFFENVSDGQSVTNPEHRLGDVVITDQAHYYTVQDFGSGLEYDLEFIPPTTSLFSSVFDFSSLGVVTNHQLYSNDGFSNVVLAEYLAGDAKYKRLILGGDSYQSSTVDTLTLINILDGNDYATSTPAKQLVLRYRDVKTGAPSLTSFDLMYDISSNIEYKAMGDTVANVGIIKDNNTTETTNVVNTMVMLFTGGVSNWKTATEANSLFIKKLSSTTWGLKVPSLHELRIGADEQIILSNGWVGFGRVPTRNTDLMGAFNLEETDPLNPLLPLGYVRSSATNVTVGFKTQSTVSVVEDGFEGVNPNGAWSIDQSGSFFVWGLGGFFSASLASLNIHKLQVNANNYLEVSSIAARAVAGVNGGFVADSASSRIYRDSLNYVKATTSGIEMVHASLSNYARLNSDGFSTPVTYTDILSAISSDVNIIPKTPSDSVKLYENVQMLNSGGLTEITPTFTLSGTSGTSSITDVGQAGGTYDHAPETHDRYITAQFGSTGGGALDRIYCAVEESVGSGIFYVVERRNDVDAFTSTSFLVPAGCKFRIEVDFNGSPFSTEAKVVSRKFGI